MHPATLRYAEAKEPANLRQCWSSYPFVDDQLMPTLQAVDGEGRVIATLANVSQHAESLGFNPDEPQRRWISADWVHFFRRDLEQPLRRGRDRDGRIGRQRRDAGGLPEGDLADPPALHRREPSGGLPHPVRPHRPAGPGGLSARDGGARPDARQIGGHGAHQARLGRRTRMPSGGPARTSASRSPTSSSRSAPTRASSRNGPDYERLHPQFPVAPNGATSGDEIQSQVAAFRIGDGIFASVPGEVFPFTYLRGFLGPADMPHPQYGLSPWVIRHMHAPFRFIDGLGEDMVGYIFPEGTAWEFPARTATRSTPTTPTASAAAIRTTPRRPARRPGNIAGVALVQVLDSHLGQPEAVARGRYVLPDGSLSRDPLGGPEIKCDVDTQFHFAGRAVGRLGRRSGPARPAAWMSLDGRRQSRPDRNTRGYFTQDGKRHWLDVFAPLAGSSRPLRRGLTTRHGNAWVSWRAMRPKPRRPSFGSAPPAASSTTRRRATLTAASRRAPPSTHIPDDWFCPVCGARKADFEPYEE